MKKDLTKQIVRPTIRTDKEFNNRLKKVLDEQGISMQQLVLRYLESYVETLLYINNFMMSISF